MCRVAGFKSETKSVRSSILKDKEIADKLDISDRIDTTAQSEAFITLKDHKPNFTNKPTCRLINPCKSEIGKISKQILERINSQIIKATNLNQWKNTDDVIQWFNGINNKQKCSFIAFDVCDFYPSSLRIFYLVHYHSHQNMTLYQMMKNISYYKQNNPLSTTEAAHGQNVMATPSLMLPWVASMGLRHVNLSVSTYSPNYSTLTSI